MSNRRALSNLGSHVYGLGAIALGLIGLVWGDFASVWQLFRIPFRIARHWRTSWRSACFRQEWRCNGVALLRLVRWRWLSCISRLHGSGCVA